MENPTHFDRSIPKAELSKMLMRDPIFNRLAAPYPPVVSYAPPTF